jgi:hypothetical protein
MVGPDVDVEPRMLAVKKPAEQQILAFLRIRKAQPLLRKPLAEIGEKAAGDRLAQ